MRLGSNVLKWIKFASWTKALVGLVIAQSVYLLMLFVTIPGVKQYSKGMDIFDMKATGYSSEYAQVLLETLGETGRSYYLTRQLPLDLIYPGVMALTWVLLITLFARRLDRRWGSLIIVPIAAAVFDYLENGTIVAMLVTFPNVQESLAALSSTFTVVKSMISLLNFAIVSVLFLLYLYKLVQSRRSARTGKNKSFSKGDINGSDPAVTRTEKISNHDYHS